VTGCQITTGSGTRLYSSLRAHSWLGNRCFLIVSSLGLSSRTCRLLRLSDLSERDPCRCSMPVADRLSQFLMRVEMALYEARRSIGLSRFNKLQIPSVSVTTLCTSARYSGCVRGYPPGWRTRTPTKTLPQSYAPNTANRERAARKA
jgi:hypothetical protein